MLRNYRGQSGCIFDKVTKALKLLLLLFVAAAFVEREARAYADPGSGALLWQLLTAGFVGALFYLRKLAFWFRSRRGEAKKMTDQ